MVEKREWELIGIYDSYFSAPELEGFIMLVEKAMIDMGYHKDIPQELHENAPAHSILAICIKGEKEDILRHLGEEEFDVRFDSKSVGFSAWVAPIKARNAFR